MQRIAKQPKEARPFDERGEGGKLEEDIFAEDFQFEIDTSRKNTESRTGGLGQHSYIERLEAKIQNQAKRLSELEKYKYIAEKREKPLNEEESFTWLDKSVKTKQSSKAKQRYDELYVKYSKLLNDFNELAVRKTSEGSVKHSLISDISSENASNVKSKEAYSSLKAKYKSIANEKNKITEALRQEGLKVEEQKNIISILKQTLDSEFIKTGALAKHITPANLIDFTQIKAESENYRKQLVLSQALVNSLKSEIDDLSKEKDKAEKLNNELASSNQSLIEKVSLTERELNNKVSKYKAEIGAMKKEMEGINMKPFDDVNSYESQLVESTKRDRPNACSNANAPINLNLRSNLDLKNKLEEALSKYHMLSDQHQAAIASLDKEKNDNAKLKNKLEAVMKERTSSVRELHDYLQLKEESKVACRKVDDLTKTNVKLRKVIDELEQKLTDSHSKAKEAKSLESELKAKKAELKAVEKKHSAAQHYISLIKGALNKLFTSAIQYSHQYTTLMKEDNVNLLNKQFASSLSSIINQLNSLSHLYLNQTDKQSLNDKDIDCIDIVISLLKTVKSEFQSIYSKVFESSNNSKESTIKASILEEKLKEETSSYRQDNKTLIKQMESMASKNESSKAKINGLKKSIEALESTIHLNESQLKESSAYAGQISTQLALMTNDKDRIQSIVQLLPNFLTNRALGRLIEEYARVNQALFKLESDKAKVEEKLQAMQSEYDKLKSDEGKKKEREGEELIQRINLEQNALKELAYELQNKIDDSQSRLNEIKASIKRFEYAPCCDADGRSKMNMAMSDSNMFKTIHQEASSIGRKVQDNRHRKACILNKEPQLTDYEDSDLENNRGNGFGANKTIHVKGSRTMRSNSNLTYEMYKN